ncbi:hypothetical protein BH09VER1_BH09VER1_08260 [soil metagenome]
MRKLWLFGMASFLFNSSVSWGENPQIAQVFQKLNAGQKQTVIVYGTSLTAGGAWVAATQNWFDKNFPNQVTFFNCGRGGANSDVGVQSLEAKVLNQKPDLIVIEYSYNDAVEGAMSLEQGWKNLDTMVTGIRAKNPQAAIVLQTMNASWDPAPDKLPNSRRPRLEEYNDNYRRYAREHDLPLLDHFPAWQLLKEGESDTFHKMVPDGAHPTPAASLAVTWPAIEAFLNQAKESNQP